MVSIKPAATQPRLLIVEVMALRNIWKVVFQYLVAYDGLDFSTWGRFNERVRLAIAMFELLLRQNRCGR